MTVQEAYAQLGRDPSGSIFKDRGRTLAESLGYELEGIPESSLEAFYGIANLRPQLEAGSTVLDLGCGAGLDTLLAARRVGPTGRVVGLDRSPELLARARKAAPPQVEFWLGEAENLPFVDETFDAALANGILNLNTSRAEILRELFRVLKPGGRLWSAELVATAAHESDDWLT